MHKPAVIKSESIMYWDCDDTLVLWTDAPQSLKEGEFVDIIDPYDEKNVRLKIHYPHVKLLKNKFNRGTTVVVWSSNGYRWAEAVVNALGLQSYVHLIQSKPQAYVDDLTAGEILGERVYLNAANLWGNK